MPMPAKKPTKTKLAPSATAKTRKKVVSISEPQMVTSEEIARLAYALWESRGCQGGSPEEDWITAERQLLQA